MDRTINDNFSNRTPNFVINLYKLNSKVIPNSLINKLNSKIQHVSSPQSLITMANVLVVNNNRFAMEIPLKRRKDDLNLKQSTNHFWGKLGADYKLLGSMLTNASVLQSKS